MADHPRDPSAPEPSRQDEGHAPEADAGGGARVAKALARAGVASRREVERLIGEGRVALNGQVLDTPAVKIGASDVLTVDGKVVADAEPTRVWRYHKPVGLVTTHNDPHDRPTVFQALPPGLPRVISVGRLDLNSEGLLLLTNDGGLARALELPSNAWVRRYRARAYGRATQAMLDRLKDGVTVEGVAYGSIEARLDKVQHRAGEPREGPANVWISVAVTEGKNREVRRVLESLGLKVNRLIRLAFGPFALATLTSGAVEEVGPRVIREQLAGLVAPQNMPQGSQTQGGVQGPASPGGAAATLSRRGSKDGGEPAAKKVYKPGWARARPPKTSAYPPTRARAADPQAKHGDAAPYRATFGGRPRPDRGAEGQASGRDQGAATKSPAGRTKAGKTKTGKFVRPTGALGRLAGKRPPPRSDGSARERPTSNRPGADKSAATRSDGSRPERPVADRPRPAGPGSEKPRTNTPPGGKGRPPPRGR